MTSLFLINIRLKSWECIDSFFLPPFCRRKFDYSGATAVIDEQQRIHTATPWSFCSNSANFDCDFAVRDQIYYFALDLSLSSFNNTFKLHTRILWISDEFVFPNFIGNQDHSEIFPWLSVMKIWYPARLLFGTYPSIYLMSLRWYNCSFAKLDDN